jgi:hypothetical protein
MFNFLFPTSLHHTEEEEQTNTTFSLHTHLYWLSIFLSHEMGELIISSIFSFIHPFDLSHSLTFFTFNFFLTFIFSLTLIFTKLLAQEAVAVVAAPLYNLPAIVWN